MAFNPETVERFDITGDHGYVGQREGYVLASDYDLLLALYQTEKDARRSFQSGMDTGMEHAAKVVNKLRARMDSASNSLLDQAEAAIQGLRKAKTVPADDEIKGEPV